MRLCCLVLLFCPSNTLDKSNSHAYPVRGFYMSLPCHNYIFYCIEDTFILFRWGEETCAYIPFFNCIFYFLLYFETLLVFYIFVIIVYGLIFFSLSTFYPMSFVVVEMFDFPLMIIEDLLWRISMSWIVLMIKNMFCVNV